MRSDERGVGRDDVSLVVRERNVTAAADVVPVALLSENEFKFVDMTQVRNVGNRTVLMERSKGSVPFNVGYHVTTTFNLQLTTFFKQHF